MRALRLVLAGLTASAWFLAGVTAEAETPALVVAQAACNPNYAGTCIPPGVDDADCAGGAGNGPYFVQERNVRVVGTDVFDLDRGGVPGIGCEDDPGEVDTPDNGIEVMQTSGYPPGPAPTMVVQAPRPPSPPVRQARGRVAFTGADILPWAAAGLGLLALGTTLVLVARRRPIR